MLRFLLHHEVESLERMVLTVELRGRQDLRATKDCGGGLESDAVNFRRVSKDTYPSNPTSKYKAVTAY
jgi:hypothetical protein